MRRTPVTFQSKPLPIPDAALRARLDRANLAVTCVDHHEDAFPSPFGGAVLMRFCRVEADGTALEGRETLVDGHMLMESFVPTGDLACLIVALDSLHYGRPCLLFEDEPGAMLPRGRISAAWTDFEAEAAQASMILKDHEARGFRARRFGVDELLSRARAALDARFPEATA